MKRTKIGFTIVEVALFLGITGLLFLAVTIGVQNSIYQQRYNDSVQGFMNFLRNAYDEVLNVQSDGNGRHGIAIYGKLLTFGETGASINQAEKQTVFVYDVIADAVSSNDLGTGSTLGLLKTLKANVVFREGTGEEYRSVGLTEEFTPSWGARIQKPESLNDFVGMILIVRDPRSGTVRTYINNAEVVNVNEKISALESTPESNKEEVANGVIASFLNADHFEMKTIDFCINPNGGEDNKRRADIRLLAESSNASGVELVGLDDDSANGNKCNN